MTTHISSAPTPDLSISTVLPTVGRKLLRRALDSVLRQDLDGIALDVIVVNDAGTALPSGLVPDDERVRVINTGRGRSGCGTVRNVGAVLATGEYLHFFDDDDEMLPGAFQAFRRALCEHPNAPWVHGGVERVTREGKYLDRLPTDIGGNVLAPLLTGEWFPMQASLVRADVFFAAGGFDPRFPTSEDMDLMMRMATRVDMLRISDLVFRYSVGPEESASPRNLDVEYLMLAHEGVLDRPRVQRRALASATNPFWRSQVVRSYCMSVKRNVRERALGKAALRLTQAAQCLARSGTDGLRPRFWRDLFNPYRKSATR